MTRDGQDTLSELATMLPKHLVSLFDLNERCVYKIFACAQALEGMTREERQLARHTTVATMFFQPSTRTKLNFEAAAQAIGCSIIGFSDPKTTRAGDFYQESVEDVVRFTAAIADVLVLRHFETGIANRMAEISPVPLISAGDGYNEHPTQALGDLFTMHRALGSIEGSRIGLLGDPGIRSLRSIAIGLSMLRPAEVVFLPAPNTEIPTTVVDALSRNNVGYKVVHSASELLEACDLIETIGVRHPNHAVGVDEPADDQTPERFRINAALLRRYGRSVPILHPGPRTDEVASDVDSLTNALYFQQARNGMFVRMSLMGALAHSSQ